MNDWNSGCGACGRDLNSGWNWQPTKYGWSGSSIISTSRRSGETPEITMPWLVSASRKSLFTSYRWRCRSLISAAP